MARKTNKPHLYYIIAPTTINPWANPGCTYTVHGCKYLISRADPDAIFYDISLAEYEPRDWKLLFDQAHCLIFAGNPRFNLSNHRHYWDYGLWDHIIEARDKGIIVADLWGGSAYPLPLKTSKEMVEDILSYETNQRILDIQSTLAMVTTRDTLAEAVIKTRIPNVITYPCCSLFAPKYLEIQQTQRQYNAVVFRHAARAEPAIHALYKKYLELKKEKRTFFVCHEDWEYWWAKKNLPENHDLICIYQPTSLLEFYAKCDKIISLKLHTSLPAIAMGCQVINIALDSRSLAYDFITGPSPDYTELYHADTDLLNEYNTITPPDLQLEFIKQFRHQVVAKIGS